MVPVEKIPTGIVVDVLGLVKRFLARVKLVILEAPVVRRQGPWVTAVIGDTPKLSEIFQRSCIDPVGKIKATVGLTLLRLKI